MDMEPLRHNIHLSGWDKHNKDSSAGKQRPGSVLSECEAEKTRLGNFAEPDTENRVKWLARTRAKTIE